MSDLDLVTVDRLLTTTRAVRKRLDLTRPVPRDVVLECIRLATQAPAGQNVQRWRWLVIDDPEVRAGLADLYRRAFEPYIAARTNAQGDSAPNRVRDSAQYLAEHLQEVPVHVVPCAVGKRSPNASQGSLAGFYGSILPAVWSLQLALRSRGLGSAWTTLHLEHEDDAAALLGIPDDVSQVALLPVAYFLGDTFQPAARRAAEDLTYWNKWEGR
jgi:nitroreductase